MKILGALGLGLTILVLKFLVPRIFAGIESTLLALFDTLQVILGSAKDASQANVFTPFVPTVGD